MRLPLCLGPFLASCVLWGSSERRLPLTLRCGWPMHRQSAEGALWLSYVLRGHHPEQGLCPSLPVTASGPHCPWLGASLVFFQPLPGLWLGLQCSFWPGATVISEAWMAGENHRSEGHYHQTANRQEMPFFSWLGIGTLQEWRQEKQW